VPRLGGTVCTRCVSTGWARAQVDGAAVDDGSMVSA
jgi:hypothetical protein